MVRIVQNNFVSGIISPSLWGRSDLGAYYRGVADAENYVVSKTGSLRKRRGVRASAMTAGWTPLKAFPYRYDRTDGGVLLVFTAHAGGDADGTVRVFAALHGKDGGRISTAATVRLSDELFQRTDDFSWAAEASCTQIGDTLFLSSEKFFCKVVVTVPEAGIASATVAKEAFEQTGKPAAVSSFTAVGYSPDGEAYDGKGETTIGYMAAIVVNGVMSDFSKRSAYQRKSWVAGAYTTIRVTISSSQLDAGFDYVVVGKSVGGTYGELTRFYPEDFADSLSQTYQDKNVSPGSGIYRQSDVIQKSDNPSKPFMPRCVCAFQQRLVLANAETSTGMSPMSLWFSEIGNLYNFWADRPVNDDDPFSPTIVSAGPAFIRWTCAFQDSLLCFTDCGIFDVRSDSTQNGFSSTTCKMTLVSDVCCSQTVAPITTTAGVVFVGADDKTVYTVAYDLQSDSKKPTDRMVLSSHLTRSSRIVSMALQSYPDTVVWCVLEDGSVLSFTHQPEQEVYAWSRHRFGGLHVLHAVGTGTVTDSDSDFTYGDIVFVARDASGYVFARPVPGSWTDVGRNGSGTSVSATFTTLRPESQDRTIAGRPKNVKDVLVRLNESGVVRVRPAQGGLQEQPVAIPAGTDAASGDFKVMPRGYVDDGGRMTFVSDDGRRSEILAVVFDMEVSQ